MPKLKPILFDHSDLLPSKDGQAILILSGWTSRGRADEESIQILYNGQAMPFRLQRVPRPDVQQAYPKEEIDTECGFRLRTDLPAGTAESLSVRFNGEEVLSMDGAQMRARLGNPVRTNLDVVQSAPGILSAGGWVYSTEEGPFSYRITDTEGNEIEGFDLITRPRTDVAQTFLAVDEQVEGFMVNIMSDTGAGCVIEVSQNDHVARLPVKRVRSSRYGSIWPLTPAKISKGISYLRLNGFSALMRRIFNEQAPADPYVQSVSMNDYPAWFDMQKADSQKLEQQKRHHFAYEPKISLIVAAYNTPLEFFMEMMDSVRSQSYANWQLCIADGSTNDTLQEFMTHNTDERIAYTRLDHNGGISYNMNKAAELADGDYIALFDHDDFLEPDALYEVVRAINETGAPVVYTDEDKFSQEKKVFCDPNFKPVFSPDLLLSTNYICHFLAVSREAWQKAGPLRSEFDGAQDYDFVLRLMDLYKPEQIVHVARPLYHWRMHANSTALNTGSKTWAFDAGKKALEVWMERNGIEGEVRNTEYPGYYEVRRAIAGNPLVSVIIPNKDHIEDLDKAIRSLEERSSWRNFEIIVVENNSAEDQTFAYYERIQKEFDNVHVVVWNGPFNYSGINNFGARHARGDYYLLLNNDTEVISENLLESMLSYAQLERVGAVGAKLLFPDETIQHNGVVIGLGGIAGHPFSTEGDGCDNYRKFIASNTSIVTAACLMVPKRVFDQVGGLNEDLQVAFNDVDFCLKIRKAGYQIVQDSFVRMFHYESKSRGAEDTPAKKLRFENEEREMLRLWKDVLYAEDPYYSPNWSLSNNFHYLRSPNEDRPVEMLERYLDARLKKQQESGD